MQQLGLLSAQQTLDMALLPKESDIIVVPSEVLPSSKNVNPMIRNSTNAFEMAMNTPQDFDNKFNYANIPLSSERQQEIDGMSIEELDKSGLNVAEALYATRDIDKFKNFPETYSEWKVGNDIRNTALNQISGVSSFEDLTTSLENNYDNGVKIKDLGFNPAPKINKAIELGLHNNDEGNEVKELQIGATREEYQSPYEGDNHAQERIEAQESVDRVMSTMSTDNEGNLDYNSLSIDEGRKVYLDKQSIHNLNLDSLTTEEVLFKTQSPELARDILIRDSIGDNQPNQKFDPKSEQSNYDESHDDSRHYILDGLSEVNPLYRNNAAYFEMLKDDPEGLDEEVNYSSVPISQDRQMMLDNTPFNNLDLNHMTVGEVLYVTKDLPIVPPIGGDNEWHSASYARDVAMHQIAEVADTEGLTARTAEPLDTTLLKLHVNENSPGLIIEGLSQDKISAPTLDRGDELTM